MASLKGPGTEPGPVSTVTADAVPPTRTVMGNPPTLPLAGMNDTRAPVTGAKVNFRLVATLGEGSNLVGIMGCCVSVDCG